MACSLRSAKYGLFISNTLFLACQLILLLLVWRVMYAISNISPYRFKTLGIAYLVYFVIVFITVVIGFYGTIRGNFCCTVMFAVAIAIILVLQTYGVITMWQDNYGSLREEENFETGEPETHQNDRKYLPDVIALYVNTGAVVVEFFSLIFACCLANQIRIKNKLANQIINEI